MSNESPNARFAEGRNDIHSWFKRADLRLPGDVDSGLEMMEQAYDDETGGLEEELMALRAIVVAEGYKRCTRYDIPYKPYEGKGTDEFDECPGQHCGGCARLIAEDRCQPWPDENEDYSRKPSREEQPSENA